MDGYFVVIFLLLIVVMDVDRLEVVCEEKEEEEIIGFNNGGDEFVMLIWKLNKVFMMIMDELEIKKVLVLVRFSYCKLVKVILKGNNRKKVFRVVKLKWYENMWKMMVMEEFELMLLIYYFWSFEMFRFGVGEL